MTNHYSFDLKWTWFGECNVFWLNFLENVATQCGKWSAPGKPSDQNNSDQSSYVRHMLLFWFWNLNTNINLRRGACVQLKFLEMLALVPLMMSPHSSFRMWILATLRCVVAAGARQRFWPPSGRGRGGLPPSSFPAAVSAAEAGGQPAAGCSCSARKVSRPLRVTSNCEAQLFRVNLSTRGE